MKRSARRLWFWTQRSNSTKKKLKHKQRTWWFLWIIVWLSCFTRLSNILAMPVVDLLDVTKDDLIFPSHVLWNSSDLQPRHEALRNPSQFLYEQLLILFIIKRSGFLNHLNNNAQVLYIVLLWLDHLINNKPAQNCSLFTAVYINFLPITFVHILHSSSQGFVSLFCVWLIRTLIWIQSLQRHKWKWWHYFSSCCILTVSIVAQLETNT